MAQFSYESYQQRQQNKQFEGGNIRFFNFLKNDGDVVLVRFPYTSPNEFELYDLHRVSVNGNYRFVNCIREANQPTTACPLCAKGDVAKGRFIVKMLVYVQGQNGIEVVPCVWDRPTGFAKTLAERLNDCHNVVYKIKRIGAKGDKNTTYDIMPTMNPQIYNEQTYPSDFSAFANFKPNNFAFLDRNFEELTQFVNTGVMPERQKAQPQQTNEGYQQTPNQHQAQQQNYYNPQYQAPTQQYGAQPQYQQPQQSNFPMGDGNPFNEQPAQQQVYTQPQPLPQQPTQAPTNDGSKPTRRYY